MDINVEKRAWTEDILQTLSPGCRQQTLLGHAFNGRLLLEQRSAVVVLYPQRHTASCNKWLHSPPTTPQCCLLSAWYLWQESLNWALQIAHVSHSTSQLHIATAFHCFKVNILSDHCDNGPPRSTASLSSDIFVISIRSRTFQPVVSYYTELAGPHILYITC